MFLRSPCRVMCQVYRDQHASFNDPFSQQNQNERNTSDMMRVFLRHWVDWLIGESSSISPPHFPRAHNDRVGDAI